MLMENHFIFYGPQYENINIEEIMIKYFKKKYFNIVLN